MTTISTALAEAGLERLDGQLLLLHALGTVPADLGHRRAWLLAHGEEEMADAVLVRFRQFAARRASGEPLAYITHHKEFFGLDLCVDARVLVPRPDTELLVQWGLDVLGGVDAKDHAPALCVLDLGTGSGAVALAIGQARPDVLVDALDCSLEALQVARANAQSLGLSLRFLHGSWFAPVTARYHCIVSNPPYIADHDPHLAALCHEPLNALVSGADGMDDLRVIIDGAAAHLHPGGWLLVEHGYDQAPTVRALFDLAEFADVGSRHDLAGHERCTGGRVIGDGPRAMVK